MDEAAPAPELTRDAFLGGRLQLWQPAEGYRAATDPVLLAAACPAGPGARVLDLGCGVGTAALCLATRVPGLQLAGLEIQPFYADLARRNAAKAAVDFEIVTGDLARMPAALRQPFDHVIANPPYYPRHGTPSPDPGRAMALSGGPPLAAWIDAAVAGSIFPSTACFHHSRSFGNDCPAVSTARASFSMTPVVGSKNLA